MVKTDLIPEEGKTYNCFDDGKISLGRLYTVDVDHVIPFSEADENTLEIWSQAKDYSSHLFAEVTDFFIEVSNGENGMNGIFARTKYGGWFGIADFWNSGLLDVSGKLSQRINIEVPK